jgi:hypothetical protein
MTEHDDWAEILISVKLGGAPVASVHATGTQASAMENWVQSQPLLQEFVAEASRVWEQMTFRDETSDGETFKL